MYVCERQSSSWRFVNVILTGIHPRSKNQFLINLRLRVGTLSRVTLATTLSYDGGGGTSVGYAG